MTHPQDRRDIRQALGAVRDRIHGACARSGREISTVRLVAVTKTVSLERVAELLQVGHTLLGESRVQEARSKMENLGREAIWHFIGHLQRNKARLAVGRFAMIHGVDSEKLAGTIDRLAGEAGRRQTVLIQVNLSRESTKSGVADAELPRLFDKLQRFEHLTLGGLMTIPPPTDDPQATRPFFARLRELREELVSRTGLALPELSMGMTNDFEVAIEEGATLIRVGRALFGERPTP